MQHIVDQIKQEIRQDILDGIIPESVNSFDDLHDYVDANEYGSFTDDDSPNSKLSVKHMNYVQEAVHQWLQKGRTE